MTIDDMKTKTDAELATIQARHHHQEEPYILAEKEWQRRLMNEQNELNKELLDKQSKLIKLSIVVGFSGIVIGAIIGAALTVIGPTILSKVIPPTQKVSSEQPSRPTTETTRNTTTNPQDQKDTGLSMIKEKGDSTSLKAPPIKRK